MTDKILTFNPTSGAISRVNLESIPKLTDELKTEVLNLPSLRRLHGTLEAKNASQAYRKEVKIEEDGVKIQIVFYG